MKKSLYGNLDRSDNKIILKSFDEVSVTQSDLQEYYQNTNYTEADAMTFSYINRFIHAQPEGKPIHFEWECRNESDIESTKVILFNKSDMTVNSEYVINGNIFEIDIDNLYSNYEYAWQVICRTKNGDVICSDVSFFKTNPGRRIINLDGVKNVRDLGGIGTKLGTVIKQGLLYRSSEMDTVDYRITDKGKATAENILKIKTELDLRKPEQRGEYSSEDKSILGKKVNYFNYACAEYNHFIKSENGNEADIIRVFANIDNYPILFHCVYGADRTGTVAYLIGGLCGVEIDGLTKDYELTAWRNRTYEPYTALVESSFDLPGESLSKKIYKFFNEKLGISKMEISNIRNILTTNSAVFKSDSLRNPFNATNQWTEFRIDFRNAASVKQVVGEKGLLEYKQSEDSIRIKRTNFAKSGTIVFDDDGILEFEVK